jgi:hypothetical protein
MLINHLLVGPVQEFRYGCNIIKANDLTAIFYLMFLVSETGLLIPASVTFLLLNLLASYRYTYRHKGQATPAFPFILDPSTFS